MIHFLSVVIPAHNSLENLKNTLKSFCRQTFKNFEVIIADDGSTDGTGEFIQGNRWSFPLHYHHQENKGRAAARNLGWRNARGDIIVFVDSHCILDADFLQQHYLSQSQNENTDIAVVRGYAPTIGPIENLGKKRVAPTEKEKKAFIRHTHDPFRGFMTGNISIRKSVLQKVAGFDEDYKEYGFEDADLGWRIKKAGYRFNLNLNAIVYVFSIGQTMIQRCDKMRQAGHNAVLFKKKHRWLGWHLVNPVSRSSYFLYKAFDFWPLKRLHKKLLLHKDDVQLQNKLRVFFHSLGIAEKLAKKNKLPKTEDLFAELLPGL
jgi:glycosyltransferase involved in cell wall biosynthesis